MSQAFWTRDTNGGLTALACVSLLANLCGSDCNFLRLLYDLGPFARVRGPMAKMVAGSRIFPDLRRWRPHPPSRNLRTSTQVVERRFPTLAKHEPKCPINSPQRSTDRYKSCLAAKLTRHTGHLLGGLDWTGATREARCRSLGEQGIVRCLGWTLLMSSSQRNFPSYAGNGGGVFHRFSPLHPLDNGPSRVHCYPRHKRKVKT